LKIEVQRKIMHLTKEAMGDVGTYQDGSKPGLSDALLSTSIKYMGGVIRNEHMNAFRRTIFRQTKGKTFVHTFDINLAPSDQLRDDGFD